MLKNPIMQSSLREVPVAHLKQHRGFSLLEVLISIIVLSFGLLGVVGLQAAALKANREALYQSAGVRYARELGEMMRGNKDVGTQTSTLANPYLIDFVNTAAIPSATTNCFTGDCYSNVDPIAAKKILAESQVRDWLYRLNQELPGARVKICFDNAPFDAQGLPQWACNSGVGSATVAVIKIGWSKSSINSDSTGAAAFEKATTPSVVLPVTAGSTT